VWYWGAGWGQGPWVYCCAKRVTEDARNSQCRFCPLRGLLLFCAFKSACMSTLLFVDLSFSLTGRHSKRRRKYTRGLAIRGFALTACTPRATSWFNSMASLYDTMSILIVFWLWDCWNGSTGAGLRNWLSYSLLFQQRRFVMIASVICSILIPLDLNMDIFEVTETDIYCSYRGKQSYWSLKETERVWNIRVTITFRFFLTDRLRRMND
jgi:hypothetical protein